MTFLGSFEIREPLPGTLNMPGSGGGRIEETRCSNTEA